GLGTSTYPFGGSVTIEANGSPTLNLDASLFNYVYDDVVITSDSGYINISREYDGQRSDIPNTTPLLAENICHRDGGAEWKVNISKPSDDAGDTSYDLAPFGGVIGTMEKGSSVSVDVMMNTSDGDTAPAVINGSKALGFACGTMQEETVLDFTFSSNRKITDITTTNSNVGGLVGEMDTNAEFIYHGINNQNDSALIRTSDGYAGGIVGYNKGKSITLYLPDEASEYALKQHIEGTSGTGGVYGYYAPSDDITFDTSNYDFDCQVNGSGYDGGLFGVLDTTKDITISGNNTVKSSHASGTASAYGGLVGQYSADTISRTFEIGSLTVETHKSGSAGFYGGGIGIIDKRVPTYVKFDGFIVNKSYDAGSLTFGGLVASADNAFVDANNVTIAVSGTFKGGALLGTSESGVLRMSGTTDISNAKSAEPAADESTKAGQLVGYRNNALVFADSTWELERYNGDVSVDDIGAWGEVLRYPSVLTVDETAHTVTVASPTTSYTSIGSTSDFVISALDYQFDETQFLKFTTPKIDISNSDISISSDIELSNTGITGLTRDNDIGSEGVKCTYSGTINGNDNAITLAIGEPYGSEVTTHAKEGYGKIYRHAYNGLVGIANNSSFKNIKFSGTIDTSPKISMYIGTAAAQASESLTAESFETLSALKVTSDGDSTVYAGRAIGYCTAGIENITISSSIFDGKLTGSNSKAESCFGGVIGKIAHATNNSLDWEFTTVELKGEVSNSTAKTQRIGGLIAEINGCSSSGDLRKLTLDGVTVNGSTISGKVNSNSQGGLLGYSWLNTNVDVKSIELTNTPSVTMTGNGHTAGLVYRATGHWTITSLDMTGINMIAPNASSIGMIVNKGISKDDETLYSDGSKSAIYLELPAGSTYTLTWGSEKDLPSSGLVFDELCAYTAPSHDYIMRNGNGIISVSTSGLKMESTAEDSLSYDARTTEGKTANPNARYYYNLDNIGKEKTLSADAEKLMAWGVRQYACKNLTGLFADPSFNNTVPNGTYDMKGYSWYPITLDSSATISGTFKLYNKEFELCEAKSANAWSSLSEDTSATQHYMLHNALFYSMEGSKTLTANNVTLQGNIGKTTTGGSGMLIYLKAAGTSASAKANININGLILDGAYVHGISKNDYAPIIINNIGNYTNLNVKNVSTSNAYKSMTADNSPGLLVDTYPKAASSLIGNVGLDTSATGLNVEFSAIKLDSRINNTVVEPYNTELNNAYGTNGSIFTKATLLHQFQYDSGSNGKYDYKLSEDWSDGHHYNEDANGNKTYLGVTYGEEIGYTESGYPNTEYPGQEHIYIEGGKYVNPTTDSDGTGEYLAAFINNFLPYVATGYDKTNKTHQLKINHGATALSGCGTYNDPYVLSNGDLETIANIIGNTHSTSGTIILPVPANASTLLKTD
ncbi:MAG: hypothetical protein IJ821_08095, partial [Lachnospiraceae bacterium]|nr:hypothetical protein [Lachnospiraceae bacterium]